MLSVGWSKGGIFEIVVGTREGRVNRYYKATKLHRTITIMSVCVLVRLLACVSEYETGILL